MTELFLPEYVDLEPIYFRKFKKTVPLNGGWEDRVFYEIKKPTRELHHSIEWCEKNYGGRRYSDTWWNTQEAIIMNEKIYIHYKLIE